MTNSREYRIRRAVAPPEGQARWEGPMWSRAETLDIDRYYAKSSEHRPRVQARALYDDAALHVLFRVEDRYVRSTHTEYNAMVCRDSCVEFFVEPKPDKGYFNFEINCGGTLHLSYIEDPTRRPGGFAKFTPVPEEVARRIRIHATMPRVVEPEIAEPVEWRVEYAVPLAVFEEFVGALGALPGQVWRGNFYKCADETSHPHWASWSPIEGELNFHQPRYFGRLRFE
jgi:hypothetical protein